MYVLVEKLPPVEYKVFKEYYGHLKSILSAQNLSQYLVSADVITFQDEEEICAAKTLFAKAAFLLQRLAGPMEHGDTYGFYQLLHVMETHGNIATKDLASRMKNAVSSLQKGQPISVSSEPAQNASQSAAVSHQSPSLPQHVNTMPLVSATSNPSVGIEGRDSYEIVDLKGTTYHNPYMVTSILAYVHVYIHSTYICKTKKMASNLDLYVHT